MLAQEDQALSCSCEEGSVKSDDSQQRQEAPIYTFPGFWSSFSFIFAIVFSQHVSNWNFAFASASVGPFLLALFVTGFAVATYVFCMVSNTPYTKLS